MSVEQNKSIVRRWIDEGWNKHNVGKIDEFFPPDVVQHGAQRQTKRKDTSALRSFAPRSP